MTDLAVNEEVTQPSMTALVTQLEELGFAERRRDPTDARVVLVAITRAGRQHLRSMRRDGAKVFILEWGVPDNQQVEIFAHDSQLLAKTKAVAPLVWADLTP